MTQSLGHRCRAPLPMVTHALVTCGAISAATTATARDGANLRAVNASQNARVDPGGAADSWQGLTAMLGTGG